MAEKYNRDIKISQKNYKIGQNQWHKHTVRSKVDLSNALKEEIKGWVTYIFICTARHDKGY